MRPPLKWLLLLLAVGLPLLPGWSGAVGVLPVLAQAAPNRAQQAEADRLLQQGIEQYQVSQFREALQSWEQALAIYREIGEASGVSTALRAGEAQTLNNIGEANQSLGNYPTALEYHQQSLAVSREMGDSPEERLRQRAGEAQTLNNIGVVNRLLGNYPTALEYHQQSLVIAREIGEAFGASEALRTTEAKTLNNIGIVNRDLGNYPAALDYYEQSLVITREIGNRAAEAETLNGIGSVNGLLGNYPAALDYFEQSLVITREIGNRATEAETLNGIGNVSRGLGNDAAALDHYEQSLMIAREIGDRAGEAKTLHNIGVGNEDLGNYPVALDYYEQSLMIKREIGNRVTEASTLNGIGNVNRDLGNYSAAVDHYEQSLMIAREIGDRASEASILNNIGIVNKNLGNYPAALDYYEQSLMITREIGNLAGEARTLNNIGEVNRGLGNYPAALDYYEQSLMITREIGDRATEAATLNNIGIVNDSLGNYPAALDYYEPSLVISRELGDRGGEAGALNNIGEVNRLLGNYPAALDYYEQSLMITREIGDRAFEASILNNIGIVNKNWGNYSAALDYYEQSLMVTREIGDRAGEALTLNNIGNVNKNLGNYPAALDYYEQSLMVTREIGDRAGEARTLDNIGSLYQAQGQPELAIVFYKDAVNTFEAIRTDNRTLDQELQDSYTETVVDTYRTLTDLLLAGGRILEAQQVLELLKAEELRQFTRASFSGGTLTYDPAEQPIVESHGSLIALGTAIAECDPNCDQTLYDQQIALERQYDQTVASFEQTVRQARSSDNVFYDPANLSSDALDLVNAQPGTVLIYPVVLEDRLWLLWTATGGVVGSVEVSVGQGELSRAALRFRELLGRQDAQSYAEFKTVAQQLYGWLIAPLEPELENNSTRHLIFAQDRTTRYLPMAALYDGSEYLLENYTVSTVLSAALTDTQGRLGDADAAAALGLGLTQAIPGFSPLPNVAEELRAMIRSADNADGGIYPGQIFLDEAFTFEALSQNVRRANILHIATHAEFVPSTQGESYILSGTGQRLALSDIGALDNQFRNLHLVVLSACQTALGGAALDGTEIAGVSSYFLGRNKAKTVMATLWKVDDAGTSLLMQRFYALLATGELTTAEALRQAQLSLLKGEASLDDRMAHLGVSRGFDLAEPEGSSVGLAHPYFWAPFILIGNPL